MPMNSVQTFQPGHLKALAQALSDACSGMPVLCDEPLAKHTTFQIGGPADILVEPGSFDEIVSVVRFCNTEGIPLHILGRGSNILVADAGVRGVVLKLGKRFSAIGGSSPAGFDDVCPQTTEQKQENNGSASENPVASLKENPADKDTNRLVYVQAGATNEDAAESFAARGLSGYEFACGIPGTIGGAAVMNAGAYEGEFKDVAYALDCVDMEGNLLRIRGADARFGYRSSYMQEHGLVVVGVMFVLSEDDPQVIRARIADFQQRRAAKQPLEMPSAGSTFKRPQGYFAGQLIQQAGLRGFRLGGAQVSEKHTGFVVNAENATAEDVLNLISEVQRCVYETSGVHLQPEVRLWGF